MADIIYYSETIFCYIDKEVKDRFIISGSDEHNNLEIRVNRESLKSLNAQITTLLED